VGYGVGLISGGGWFNSLAGVTTKKNEILLVSSRHPDGLADYAPLSG
jgi:hypothetical protein